MNPDLEILLRAYDALMESAPREVAARDVFYRARLEEIAAARAISKDVLHQLIQRKYPAWIRAQQKPSSIPPKA